MSTAKKAKIDVANDGAVLSAVFDRASPTLAADVEAFGAQLANLQKARGFTDFLRSVQEDGARVVVKIVPARPAHAPDDLAQLGSGAEVAGGAAGFEAARKGLPSSAAGDRGPPVPGPAADKKLIADLKKALFIPRR
ncbi:MAG: hypothetical protein Q8O67_33950 [Deltaproteobacteria bacterium]|nr:hypothetical protein [Deltaproteobacteria bacterium]